MHLTVGLFLTKSVASRMKMLLIELLKAKCLPSLYYGLEACPINKSQIKSCLLYTSDAADDLRV